MAEKGHDTSSKNPSGEIVASPHLRDDQVRDGNRIFARYHGIVGAVLGPMGDLVAWITGIGNNGISPEVASQMIKTRDECRRFIEERASNDPLYEEKKVA